MLALIIALAVVSLPLFAAPSPAHAATIVVNSTGDAATGCPTTCTLRAAIASAALGDTITFSLTLPASIVVGSPLPLTQDLTITGPGAAQLAVDGNHAVTVFTMTAGTV